MTDLDKLAQLSPKPETAQNGVPGINPPKKTTKALQKRARAKYLTNGITDQLRRLDSPLKQSYINTFFCASVLIQEGQKLTGKYCNNRWCLVCNRIRTGQLINGYRDALEALPDKHFVTLTVPNVPADQLAGTIRNMLTQVRRITNLRFRKRGTPLIGIRKLEVTYNPIRNDFHPHFHFVVSGHKAGSDLVSEWLETFTEAKRSAQDIRPADLNASMELFKYFTKVLTKGTVYPSALDVIFQAMKGLRVFQPMGIKKFVPEDIDEVQAELYQDLDIDQDNIWHWRGHDWVNKETGELLSDYVPSENFQKAFFSG